MTSDFVKTKKSRDKTEATATPVGLKKWWRVVCIKSWDFLGSLSTTFLAFGFIPFF